ncbi:MAG: AGE family epimerase/isomerase [Verrucomicrobia bacterium]|nr:AGE family epimerase/isomerase [Verrucomicrobiota bacterium]
MTYLGTSIPEDPSDADLKAVCSDYAVMCTTVMRAIADRYDPAYPFVNTKLDLITGQDFDADDPVRGKQAVYGWIQGRALEALAGHARWLSSRGEDDLVERLRSITRDVLDQLRRMRDRNEGHLSFFMYPDGTPFQLDPSGRPVPTDTSQAFGFSDLFSSKGMFAAARYLGDDEAVLEACEYIDEVEEAIWDNTFQTDQISLDPKNPTEPRSGYHAHGPFMIQIGSAALLVQSRHPTGIERGIAIIEHELSSYVSLDGRVRGLEEGDFFEGVDTEGQPYRDDAGVLLSDPGHSLEFVGLAMKFIHAANESGDADEDQNERIDKIRKQLPIVLERNFNNGYIEGSGGISKAFDLVTRKHLNTDMPWWNLPETIRAAAYCLASADDETEKALCSRIFRDCHNAFLKFVRPDLHLMAYQTRDASGNPVSVIPATADADPGYHTGLSLIDTIEVLNTIHPE